MNYQDVAEELLQTVLLHKNLFIDRANVIKEITTQLELSYNRGYDAGQDSRPIVKDLEKQMEAMANDPNIKADCAAILNEESGEKKLDAIVEEFKEAQRVTKELADKDKQRILDKVMETLK